MRALGLVVLVVVIGTVVPAVPTLVTPAQSPETPSDGQPTGGPISTTDSTRGDVGDASDSGPDPSSGRSNRSRAAIVAVYPNPVEENDRGEYVLLEYPRGAGWSLSDGETSIRLPGSTRRAVVTADPAVIDDAGDAGDAGDSAAVVVAGDLRLANDGETLWLRHGSTVVDVVSYERAVEGEILEPPTGEWNPVGATDFDPVRTGPGRAKAFVLPDAPSVVVRTLRGADRRVLLGGYTVSSWRIARELVAARERGATVRVLVDGSPVGGMTRRQAQVLDWLVDNGVPVAVLSGPRARYDFHHAKYAVVDDRAVVLTENYKPAGTGGAGEPRLGRRRRRSGGGRPPRRRLPGGRGLAGRRLLARLPSQPELRIGWGRQRELPLAVPAEVGSRRPGSGPRGPG